MMVKWSRLGPQDLVNMTAKRFLYTDGKLVNTVSVKGISYAEM